MDDAVKALKEFLGTMRAEEWVHVGAKNMFCSGIAASIAYLEKPEEHTKKVLSEAAER